jgi:dTDP-glucose 4,6-dehydratase
MTRMLVTGGAGFIGANFIHYTLKHHPEFEICVLDALTYAGNLNNLSSVRHSVRFVHNSICDRAMVESLVRESDVVVHFAAESHVDNSLDDPEPFIQSNILGTFRILEAVRRYDKRLHHISTDEVFGDLAIDSPDKFTEETRYNPSSPYSASKASSDMLVRAWVRSFGVAATISCCANNYGPYQHVEKFIPRQITNILTGERPKLYGQGVNVREWTYVDDHSDAIHLILQNGELGESYLIGSGNEYSNKQILSFILQLMDQPADAYDCVEDRPGHDLRYANDTSKIRRKLGWSPRLTDMQAALVPTIEWYQQNEWWWRPQKEVTEAHYRVLGR